MGLYRSLGCCLRCPCCPRTVARPQVGGGRGVGASHVRLCMWPWKARKDVLCTPQAAGARLDHVSDNTVHAAPVLAVPYGLATAVPGKMGGSLRARI